MLMFFLGCLSLAYGIGGLITTYSEFWKFAGYSKDPNRIEPDFVAIFLSWPLVLHENYETARDKWERNARFLQRRHYSEVYGVEISEGIQSFKFSTHWRSMF